MINGNFWLLGKTRSLATLRGLEWTVYQFCTTNKNAWKISEIFKKQLISSEVELQRQSRKVRCFSQLCYILSFRLHETHPSGISAFQNTTLMMHPSEYGNRKKLKTYREKLVNYILGAN